MGFIVAIIIGGIAGWLAGQVMRGKGYGCLGNVLIGIIGGFVGNLLFNILDISIGSEILSAIITSTCGAIAIIFFVRLLR